MPGDASGCASRATPEVELFVPRSLQPASELAICIAALAFLAEPALAHSAEAGATWWALWNFTPLVVAATALVLWIYARGAARTTRWRRVGFLSGTLILFLALQSPLDALAERSFAAHQLQHLALLSLAPLLLSLAEPAGALLAGMPDPVLRRVYLPLATLAPVRALTRFLSRPPAAAGLYIVTQLSWLLPFAHSAALRHAWVHEAMHFSMLVAGMFLFFCAFDSRSPPSGARYGARVFALLAVLLFNVPLGAYLSYKTTVLYPFYPGPDRLGRTPLLDEQLGGVVQYVPGSMMLVLAVLLALRAWHRRELHLQTWRQRGLGRPPSAPLTAPVRDRRNLRLALTLAAVCAFMFAAAIMSGILAHG